MKRMLALAILCAFVLSAAAASAADIKASGAWAVEAVWRANWSFNDKGASKSDTNGYQSFEVSQRARTIFDFVANENLKAVLYTAFGTQEWGSGAFKIGNGDNNSATNQNYIVIKQAYLDFKWPDTDVNVRAGLQAVSLPAAFGGGSYILDEEMTAAVVTAPLTDNITALVGYGRAIGGGSDSGSVKDYIDGYVAALPMQFDGFSFAPFGVYAPIGDGISATDVMGSSSVGNAQRGLAALNATDYSGADFNNAYWLGAAFTMDLFDPFVLKADVNYGKVDSDYDTNKRSGWLFDAALEYKGLDFMTPEVFFVYTSGEDGNSTEGGGESERMPILAAQNWAIGSFFFGGDTLLDGSINNRKDTIGYWALGLSLKDIQSFAEGLTHTAHIIYAKGTNDKDSVSSANGAARRNISYGATLTEEDSLIEVDFNTAYKLYDELTMTLDLGYVNLDADSSVWGTDYKGGDAWKLSTGVVYKF